MRWPGKLDVGGTEKLGSDTVTWLQLDSNGRWPKYLVETKIFFETFSAEWRLYQ
jgi:hypothetical protein